MSHGNIQIREFIRDISNGDYVIPHFQRDFDWEPSMVSDLFKSILHNYYSGTILLWTLEDDDRKIEMWDSLWGAEKNEKPSKAILDGQQRLSSIFYALCAPKKKFPRKTTFFYFFINLDETFLGNEDESITSIYYRNYKDKDSFKKDKDALIEKGLFPLCLLSDDQFIKGSEYEKWLIDYVGSRKTRGESELAGLNTFTVTRKIEGILNYVFLTETLEKKQPKEICTIFANINSKGLKLDIFDLMNAFLFPKGIQLRKDWEQTDIPALKGVDTEMKVYILKLISLYKQIYCSSRYLYNLIPGSEIKDRQGNKTILVKDSFEFNQLWTISIKYAEKARKKLMSSGVGDFGAIKTKFIPNTTIIPVLGALILYYETNLKETISEKDFYDKIKRWYWCAVISGDYGGSSDSIMAKDYRDVIEWLQDNTKIPDRVKKITSVFVDSLNLEKVKNTNSSQYCAVLNMLALNSAKDFYTGRILGNYPIEEIHDHHIFSLKAGLKISDDKLDSILNRTLIVNETNNKIKNKTPKNYYGEILQKFNTEKEVEELMESHLISTKALKFFKENNFEEFIKERNSTIKEQIKRIIGIIGTEEDTTLIAPGKDYDNEITYISHIEDYREFVYILDPYFKENTIRLLRKGLFNNKSIKNIRIIAKSDAIDEDFRQSFKSFSKQMKNEGIEVEIRIVIEPKIQTQLHDRYLITKDKSYNFVGADAVKRGQLSHIVEVSDVQPYFNSFWEAGKELLANWNEIMMAKVEKQKRIEEMKKTSPQQ